MSTEPTEQFKQDTAKIEASLAALSEHFDTVVIVATRYDGGPDRGTLSYARGVGNWYARYASVREFLIKCDNAMAEHSSEL